MPKKDLLPQTIITSGTRTYKSNCHTHLLSAASAIKMYADAIEPFGVGVVHKSHAWEEGEWRWAKKARCVLNIAYLLHVKKSTKGSGGPKTSFFRARDLCTVPKGKNGGNGKTEDKIEKGKEKGNFDLF